MTIDTCNFAGHKAIVRVDFNVPLDENGNITDDTRIRGALPTLKKILADGGALIIMSHMGKPKGKVNPKLSLGQIKEAVAAALNAPVTFAPDCAKAQEAAAALKPGEVLLLENLRFYPEEEGKPVGIDKEDPAYDQAKKEMKVRQQEFAKTLASYADYYVMLRHSTPQARFYGSDRRLFRRRPQDARLSHGERSRSCRQHSQKHQASLHSYHGWIESVDKNRHHREPHG